MSGFLGMSSFGELRGVMTLDYQRYVTGLGIAASATERAANRIKATNARAAQANAMLGAASILGIVRPLTRVGSAMNDAQREYSRELAKIASITAKLGAKEMNDLDKAFIQIGKSSGVLPTLVAQSGYVAVQSMYEHVSQIKSIAKEASEMKIASGWEIEPKAASEMYTRFLKMLSMPTTELETLSDVFLATRNVGVMTMDDIAEHAGRAASVFVSAFPKDRVGAFKDMLGLAASASYTLAPDQVFTGLRGIMDRVFRESREVNSNLNKIAQSMGYTDAVELLEKSGSMSGFLKKIKSIGGEGLRYITSLGYERREQSVISSLLTGSSRTDMTLNAIMNSKGTKARAMAANKGSKQYLYDRYEAFKQAFNLSFGKITIEYAAKLMDYLGRIFNYFEELPETTRRWAVLGAVLAGVLVTVRALASVMRFFGVTSMFSGFASIVSSTPTLFTKAGIASKIRNMNIGAGLMGRNVSRAMAGTSRNNGLGAQLISLLLGNGVGAFPTVANGLRSFANYRRTPSYTPYPNFGNLPYGASSYAPGASSPIGYVPNYLYASHRQAYHTRQTLNNPALSGMSTALAVDIYRKAMQLAGMGSSGILGTHHKSGDTTAIDKAVGRVASKWMQATQPVGTMGVFTKNIAAQSAGYGILGAGLGAKMVSGFQGLLKWIGILEGSALGQLVLGFTKFAGILLLVVSVVRGWWAAVKDTFDGFGTALGMLIPGFNWLQEKISAFVGMFDSWHNVFALPASGVISIMNALIFTFRHINETIIGFGMFIGTVITAVWSGLSGFLKPGYKQKIYTVTNPDTGRKIARFATETDENGKPIKQKRSEAFADAWDLAFAAHKETMKGMNTKFVDDWKEAQKKAQDIFKFNYPTPEFTDKGAREAEERLHKDENPSDQQGPEFTAYKAVREYASAMLHGSVDAWNARAPAYLTEDKAQTQLMRDQLKQQKEMNKNLSKMSKENSTGASYLLEEGNL